MELPTVQDEDIKAHDTETVAHGFMYYTTVFMFYYV